MAEVVLLRPELPLLADPEHECRLRRHASVLASQLPERAADAAKVLSYMAIMLAFVTAD